MFSQLSSGETLVSDNFKIEIETECEEGVVSCDKMKFILFGTGFEQEQTIKGTTTKSKT